MEHGTEQLVIFVFGAGCLKLFLVLGRQKTFSLTRHCGLYPESLNHFPGLTQHNTTRVHTYTYIHRYTLEYDVYTGSRKSAGLQRPRRARVPGRLHRHALAIKSKNQCTRQEN